MTVPELTDVQLERALRAIAPPSAPAGLDERIHADVVETDQVRSLPTPLVLLSDPDPAVRRRLVLLAAAALVALSIIAAGAVGAWLRDSSTQPLPPVTELRGDPPADIPALARSAYDRMPELGPMTITAVEDGGPTYRIAVAETGAVRIDTYDAPTASTPSATKIYSGTTAGEAFAYEGGTAWHVRTDAISEDPRVFVYATLGAAWFAAGGEPGCETSVSPGETYANEPGFRWRWLGMESIAGHQAHHLACDGELWLDAETGLALRSRGTETGGPRTIEVTEIIPGDPPADQFAMTPPPGAQVLDEATYSCVQDPYCLASPAPIITPPPATGSFEAPDDLDALVAGFRGALEALGAFDATIDFTNTKHPGSTTRVVADGSGRNRQEIAMGGPPGQVFITIEADGHRYVTDQMTDGTRFWRESPGREAGIGWVLSMPDECAGGWTWLGVDRIGDRPADHVSCPGRVVPDEFWLDRETHLLLRTQTQSDPQSGTDILEVTALSFEPPSPDLFRLPPDADLRPTPS